MSDDRPIGAVSPLFTWRTAVVRSELPSTTKLVALVLSLYMSELGDGCFPSYATIAERCSISRSTTIDHVGKLVKGGWLERERRRKSADSHDSNIYRATTPFEQVSGGGSPGAGLGGSPGAGLGVVREHDPTAPSIPRKDRRPDVGTERSRKRDPVWDSLAAIFGEPTTKTEKTHRGKLVREIRAALQDEFGDDAAKSAESRPVVELLLRDRRTALARHWGDRVFVTGDALVKHWTLAKTLVETGRPDSAATVDEKIAKWLVSVGVRMDDENDVRGFLLELARGDEAIADRAIADWKKRRKEVSDGDDAAA